jgi:hypothetical protein
MESLLLAASLFVAQPVDTQLTESVNAELTSFVKQQVHVATIEMSQSSKTSFFQGGEQPTSKLVAMDVQNNFYNAQAQAD